MNPAPIHHDIAILLAEASKQKVEYPHTGMQWTESELVDLAKSLDLKVEYALLLILKAKWESFLDRISTSDSHKGTADEDIDRDFDPDPAVMLATIEAQNFWPQAAGGVRTLLLDMIREATLNKLYRFPIRSPECERFAAGIRAEANIIDSACPDMREQLTEARGVWIMRCSVHADLLLALVNQQLANARIYQQFLQLFGDTYMKLEELVQQVDSLHARILLKEANPNLTSDSIEEQMWEKDEKKRRAFNEMSTLMMVVTPPPGYGNHLIRRDR